MIIHYEQIMNEKVLVAKKWMFFQFNVCLRFLTVWTTNPSLVYQFGLRLFVGCHDNRSKNVYEF